MAILVTYKQRAFTLVEMAMVMVIMGVLMGGVLTGIKILQNAKVAATVGQVQAYRAAVVAFEKTYHGMPGDLPNAHKKIRGCQKTASFAGCELVVGGGAVAQDICAVPECETTLANDCSVEVSNQQNTCSSNVSEGSSVCPLKTTSQSDIDDCNSPAPYPWGGSPPQYYGAPTLEACLAWKYPKPYSTIEECYAGEGYYSDTASCITGEGYYTDTATCEEDKKYDGYYTSVLTQVPVTGVVGDGIVGPVSWDMFTFRGESFTSIDGANAVDAETLLFWYELKQAGLITGVTGAGLQGAPKARFGFTHPMAEIGGGFWAGHSDGCCGAGNSVDATSHTYTGRPGYAGEYSLLGNVLTLVKIPTGGKENDTVTISGVQYEGYRISSAINKNALTPNMAADIDRKLDDGYPDLGAVQAFGVTATCYGGFDIPFMYDERETNKDCGLYIRIK